jgi:mono/diheme cytochrome c family protein
MTWDVKGTVGAAAFFAAVLAALALFLMKTSPGDPFSASDGIARGKQVYAANCAKCHGANLEGQPNWQDRLANGRMPAPPHDATGHTWHHADAVLAGITKNGLKPYAGENYESDMPAFGAVLSDEDIAAIWTYIKSTWPDRQREYQATITRQYEQQPKTK